MRKIMVIYPLLAMALWLITASGCKKNKELSKGIPVLTTIEVSNISYVSASCGGNISSDGGDNITARGVCWGTNDSPTIADNKTADGTGNGGFTSAVTGLIANTTYYIRAYATNSVGTGYGNVVSFKTLIDTTIYTVTDIDGNVYHTVTIGSQVWMVENLKVSRYRNGDPIPNITDAVTWSSLSTGAYCDYLNQPDSSAIYGKLYNFYAGTDPRNICPIGWHLPTKAEFETLISYLGGGSLAGGKLKEAGYIHWQEPNVGATNETGFTFLPAGYRKNTGTYFNLKIGSALYSSTTMGSTNSWVMATGYNHSSAGLNQVSRLCGYSIRCIKD